MRFSCWVGTSIVLVLGAVCFLSALSSAPPAVQAPPEAKLQEINNRMDKLAEKLTFLRRNNVHDPILADVEIYYKAAQWITQYKEFYDKDAVEWTLDALAEGLLRVNDVTRSELSWLQTPGKVAIRAHRSKIDGSVQPYVASLPAEYGKDKTKAWRVDVVLHDRDPSLTEIKFLHQHGGGKPTPKDQDFVRLDIYGRGNNGYRWAGETDVMEAIDNFVAVERLLGRGTLLDSTRIVLRGFGMGGTGTWHLGLHRPDRWCVLGPGGGVTATQGLISDLPKKLSSDQEACLRIYDAVDYACNAFNVPVVAYVGANDPQLTAVRTIETKLKSLNIPITLLTAPNVGHEFPPDWRKKADSEYAKYVAQGRAAYPPKVKFSTYTLKYSSCDWVEILALDHHYQQAVVEAERRDEGFEVKTKNVRALQLRLSPNIGPQPQNIHIDDQNLTVRPSISPLGAAFVALERRKGQWQGILLERLFTQALRQPFKCTRLQGPVDDAFTDSFLCVRGTGKPWHEKTQQYAEANLERFQQEWAVYFRGDLPIKEDLAVTSDDIANKHLILFGDPSSNSLIAQVLDGLPLQWTSDKITLAGQTVPAGDHVPVLIYPSPLNYQRYVVLNSGHTFRADDFQGKNARLYPRLGDYALLKLTPGNPEPVVSSVTTAGLFDDSWQVKK